MKNLDTKRLQYPVLLTIAGTILLLVMVILPFASAKKEHKEKLTQNAEQMYVEEIEMTNADAVHISLVEFVHIYSHTFKQEFQKEISIVCIVLVAMFAVFAFFAMLMAIVKKPIGVMIFDILAMVVFGIIHYDFADRGVIPSRLYDWGIVNYLTYLIGGIVIAGAIWMLVKKRKLQHKNA
jgi:hypothetical protein